jgi:signal transduction histidine kinase
MYNQNKRSVSGIIEHLLDKSRMETTHGWSTHRIYYLACGLYFGAVVLRSLLIYQNDVLLPVIAGLLAAWLALFTSQPFISRRWPPYFPVYMTFQMGLVAVLLLLPRTSDFFSLLVVILSMQFALEYSPKTWAIWTGLCALGLSLLLTSNFPGGDGISLALIYSAGNALMGAFPVAVRRSQAASQQNQDLAAELSAANQQLQAYASQLEQLAVGRERNRLARELHDSVTQTVFSMNLTSQSAALLLEKDPARADEQLEHLRQLAGSALEEMGTLISELRPQELVHTGLAQALRRHLEGLRLPEGTSISLEVQGERSLQQAEQQGLYRIAQEALNNILKHAHASRACITLHLDEPLYLEIQDQGQGFDLEQARRSGRIGLSSMQERAAEIGWQLQIQTQPGAGTTIRVAKAARGEGQVAWEAQA